MKVTKLNGIDKQTLKVRRGEIEACMMVLHFQDHDHFISYLPAFDLSGYGDTHEESFEMLNVQVKEVLIDLIRMTPLTRLRELKKYGWEKHSYLRKFVGPYIDEKGILKEFELPESTSIQQQALYLVG